MIVVLIATLIAGSYPEVGPEDEVRLAERWIGRTPAEMIERLGKFDGGHEDADSYWLIWTEERKRQDGSLPNGAGASGTSRIYPALRCSLSIKVEGEKITRLTLRGQKQMCRKLIKAAQKP